MAYLDGVLEGSQRAFPWELVALERPGLEQVIRALVAHGLLATAVVAELQQRGWLDEERHAPAVAAAIHRRFVNRRRAVGPYAPLVAVPVGRCAGGVAEAERLARRCAAEAEPGVAAAAAAAAACAACGRAPAAGGPLEPHDELQPVVLCAACHADAHGWTPPLLVVELRALAERAAAAG